MLSESTPRVELHDGVALLTVTLEAWRPGALTLKNPEGRNSDLELDPNLSIKGELEMFQTCRSQKI